METTFAPKICTTSGVNYALCAPIPYSFEKVFNHNPPALEQQLIDIEVKNTVMSSSSGTFINSIRSQYKAKKYLTEKQWYWYLRRVMSGYVSKLSDKKLWTFMDQPDRLHHHGMPNFVKFLNSAQIQTSIFIENHGGEATLELAPPNEEGTIHVYLHFNAKDVFRLGWLNLKSGRFTWSMERYVPRFHWLFSQAFRFMYGVFNASNFVYTDPDGGYTHACENGGFKTPYTDPTHCMDFLTYFYDFVLGNDVMPDVDLVKCYAKTQTFKEASMSEAYQKLAKESEEDEAAKITTKKDKYMKMYSAHTEKEKASGHQKVPFPKVTDVNTALAPKSKLKQAIDHVGAGNFDADELYRKLIGR